MRTNSAVLKTTNPNTIAGRFGTVCARRLLPLLFLFALPATLQAQYNYTTNSGAITITGYTGSGGDVTIPSTINSLLVTSIGYYAFWECTNLTSVTIPNGVTFIGGQAFDDCTSLTNVTIGNTVTSIGDSAFASCTSLTGVTIGNSVTNIGGGAFRQCVSLTSVTIPNSVTSIGNYAFWECTNLTSVTIGNGVTSIGNWAFKDCTSLTSVTIGNSVSSLGSGAFYNCSSLNGVYCQGNVFSCGEMAAFQGDNNATLYYLAGTTGWNWNPTYCGLPTELWLNSWIAGSGKWETDTNWSSGLAPSVTDLADAITNANTKTVTIDATTSDSFPDSLTINNLTVSGPGVATNTLFLDNAGTVTPLQVLGVLLLGTNGAMVVNNSAVLATNSVSIGNSSASSSLVVSNGGSLIVTNGSGTGSVVVNGGSLILGVGTFKTDNLVVTNGGVVQHTQTYQVDNGSITVAGGSEQAGSNLVAGTSANSTGTVTVTDAGQLVVTNGVIGIGNSGTLTNGSGVGFMIVSNGTVLANQILLGSSVGGQGQLTIQTNGLVSLVGTNAELVANDVLVDGGAVDIFNGTLYCGITHTGRVTVVDGTADCQVVYVGDDDTGTMTISGGQTIVHTLLDIGFSSNSVGLVWMSSGLLTATNHPTTTIVIGNSGVGQLSLSNGTILTSKLFVSTTGGPGGTLTVAGGILNVSAGLTVGNGAIWVSGSGQLLVPSSLVIGINGIGQITISNGTVQANSLVLTNGANSQFAFPGGALNSGGTVVTNSQSFLVGNNSSAATFTMVGGTHWFGNGLEIANNATLTGCGVINGAVTVDAGAHAVATCGALTFSNNVTINGNGVVRASNGSVLNFAGPVVNNGAIDALNGGVNFSSPPSGTGYVLTASCLPAVTAIQHAGTDIHISFTTGARAPYAVSYETDLISGSWTTLTNVTGSGGIMTITNSGATLLPQRFYRVNLVVPP